MKCLNSGLIYIFSNIQFVNGKWYAWYSDDLVKVIESDSNKKSGE